MIYRVPTKNWKKMTLSLFRNFGYYLILSLKVLPRDWYLTRLIIKNSSSRISPIQLRRLPGFPIARANSSLLNVYLMHRPTFCGLLLSALLKIGGVEPNPGHFKTIVFHVERLWEKVLKQSHCSGVPFLAESILTAVVWLVSQTMKRPHLLAQDALGKESFCKYYQRTQVFRKHTDITLTCPILSQLQTTRKTTGWSASTVQNYLSTSSTNTNYNFPSLKVLSYRLNVICSIDLSDMQSVQSIKNGVRYILLAVDTLSRNFRVEAMKEKTATTKNRLFVEKLQKWGILQTVALSPSACGLKTAKSSWVHLPKTANRDNLSFIKLTMKRRGLSQNGM